MGVVGPALLFAQNPEQTRVRAATQDVSREAAGIVERIGGQDGRVPDQHVRLCRPGAVDEQHVARPLGARGHRGGRGRRRTRPASEGLLRERLDLRSGDVARDDEERARRAEPRAREAHEILLRDCLEALLGGAAPVGVAPVDLLREEPRCDARRLRQLERQGRQLPGARKLHLACRKRRVQRHVTDQAEQELQLVAQRVARDREKVVTRARRQTASDAFDRGGDLLRGAGGRPLGQDFRRQHREPFLPRRVVDPPGTEAQAHGGHGLLVPLDHDQLDPVREPGLLERREARGGERGRPRRTRGKRILGDQAVRRSGGQQRCQDQQTLDRPTARPPDRPHSPPPVDFAPPAPGRTITSTALTASRYLPATRRMSSAVTAR